jgi:hypothetical protein
MERADVPVERQPIEGSVTSCEMVQTEAAIRAVAAMPLRIPSNELTSAFRVLLAEGKTNATTHRQLTEKKKDDKWKQNYGGHAPLVTSSLDKGGHIYNHTDFASMKRVLAVILMIYGGMEKFNPRRHLLVDAGAGEGCAVAYFSWFLGVVAFGLEVSPQIFLAIKTKFDEVRRRTGRESAFGRMAFALGDATTFDPRGITLIYVYDGQAKAASTVVDELSKNLGRAWELFGYHRWMLSSPTVEALASSALSPPVLRKYMQQPPIERHLPWFQQPNDYDLSDDRLFLCPLGRVLEYIEVPNNSFGSGNHHTSTYVWYRPDLIVSMSTSDAQPAVPMDNRLRRLYDTITQSECHLAFDA